MSRYALCLVLLVLIVSAPAGGNTVLWLTGDEGTVGQPASSPLDSGDYSLIVAGQSGVSYSDDVAGVGAAAGAHERSFSFDGIDDLIRVTDDAVLDLTGGYTIELFMKLTGECTTGTVWQLFERRDGSQEYSLCSDPVPYADLVIWLAGSSGGAGYAGGDMPLDEWHHVAITYDPADTDKEGKAYIDGTYAFGRNYAAGQGTNFSMTADLLLGASGVYGDRYLAGLIDEVRITDEALDPEAFLCVVPEPSTVILLALCIPWVLRRRREKRPITRPTPTS